jgi:tRNA(Ile)-lysidine synthase
VTGPPAATAAVRLAVRRCLEGDPAARSPAAAVSGGADSLALAAALGRLRPGAPALVVDHGLQPGSAEVAERAAAQCAEVGLVPQVLTARDLRGPLPGGSGGPEAAARALRYALLEAAAPGDVLLGHTLDDQAETVLLGLARGAGARSLAGMAPVRGRHRRPLLGLGRAVVRQACAEAGLVAWEDPHNRDPAHARVRVRATLLPALEQGLGAGVAAALARTARSLREDADALDALTPDTDDCAVLAGLPAALRARALHRLAVAAAGRAVTSAHVEALRALVEDWRGQGPVGLPGGAQLGREGGRLVRGRATGGPSRAAH